MIASPLFHMESTMPTSNDSETAQTAATVLLDQIKNLEAMVPGKTLNEKVEIGSILWDLGAAIEKALDGIKKEVRSEAVTRLKGAPGVETLTGTYAGTCAVTIPKPSTRVVKGADMASVKAVLGSDFSLFFEEVTTYKPRNEFTERFTDLDAVEQQVLLKSVEQKENTPRVSFRRQAPVEPIKLEETPQETPQEDTTTPGFLDDLLG